ncbi:Phosphotransferase enzyme family protein [compost metagenome]
MDAISGIPGAESWTKIEPVLKGWSSDRKFYVEDQAGRKLLLRLSPAGSLHRKQREYEAILRFNGLDFPMSRAVDCGICCTSEGSERYVYMLLTWVKGVPLEERLPGLPPEEQYRLGAESGRILKQMHSIPVEEELPHWEADMQAKILSRIREYEDCPYHLEGEQHVIAFVKQNIGVIHQVEKVHHHGDFHIGNLICTPEGRIGVIDFNRWDIGDYAEEFYKLQIFDRERSIPFAKGKLEGYFGGTPPEDFWKRQALYVAYTSLYSIKWSIPYGAADIKDMMDRCRLALRDYDGFRRSIPRWYLE